MIGKSLDLVEAKTKVIVNALEVRLGKVGTAGEMEVQGQVAKSCESMRGLNAQCDKLKAQLKMLGLVNKESFFGKVSQDPEKPQ